MTTGYNTTLMQEAFSGLADVLDKAAMILTEDRRQVGVDVPPDDADARIGNGTTPTDKQTEDKQIDDAIDRVLKYHPAMDEIREAFDKAVDVARVAGDATTANELKKRYDELLADFADDARLHLGDPEQKKSVYVSHLNGNAAWLRAVVTSISTTETDAANDAKVEQKVDVLNNKVDALTQMARGGFETVIANQPQTIMASIEAGKRILQSDQDKTKNRRPASDEHT